MDIDYSAVLSASVARPIHRRIQTEEKATVCGEEFIQFLAALVVLQWAT